MENSRSRALDRGAAGTRSGGAGVSVPAERGGEGRAGASLGRRCPREPFSSRRAGLRRDPIRSRLSPSRPPMPTTPKPAPFRPDLPTRSCGPVDWGGLDFQHEELCEFLSRRCRNHHDAEDVVQDALVKAACSRAPSAASPRRLEPWLRTIAANLLTDRRRRTGRRREVGESTAELLDLKSCAPDPSEGIDDDDELWLHGRPFSKRRLIELLRRALSDSSAVDREVLVAFYGEGNGSCRAVAERLDVAPDLIKVRLYRARRRLRERCLRLLFGPTVGGLLAEEVAA